MSRLVPGAFVFLVGVLLLTGCTTDDPFSVHPAGNDNAEAPVAGAATPPPESSSAGWKW